MWKVGSEGVTLHISGRIRSVSFMSRPLCLSLPPKTGESRTHGFGGPLSPWDPYVQALPGRTLIGTPRKGRKRHLPHPPEAEQSTGGCCRQHRCLCLSPPRLWGLFPGPLGEPGLPWGAVWDSCCRMHTLPSRGSGRTEFTEPQLGVLGQEKRAFSLGLKIPSWSTCSPGSLF